MTNSILQHKRIMWLNKAFAKLQIHFNPDQKYMDESHVSHFIDTPQHPFT